MSYQPTGQINKFGHATANTVSSVVYGSTEPLQWGTTSTAMTVSSSSAIDTSTGAGAQTVRVIGPSSDGTQKVVDVSLSGQTGVSIGSWTRPPSRARVIAGGTSYSDLSRTLNSGDIYIGYGTVTAGVPATVQNVIPAGEGQTQSAFYTVPADKSGQLTALRLQTSAATKVVTVREFIRRPGEVWAQEGYYNLAGGVASFTYNPPKKLAPLTDIEYRAVTSSGSEEVVVEFDVKLYDYD